MFINILRIRKCVLRLNDLESVSFIGYFNLFKYSQLDKIYFLRSFHYLNSWIKFCGCFDKSDIEQIKTIQVITT